MGETDCKTNEVPLYVLHLGDVIRGSSPVGAVSQVLIPVSGWRRPNRAVEHHAPSTTEQEICALILYMLLLNFC